MEQVCSAAQKLDMIVVTGHTGVYKGVSQLIGVCTAYGIVSKEKLIMPGNAKAGNLILCTKSIGLELLVNFSFMNKVLARRLFGVHKAKELANLFEVQSCVNEALQLAKLTGVNSMHDATEGGLVAALNEMSDASGVGFKVEMEKIPISEEIWILRNHFKLSLPEVLSMSSSGTILAAIKPKAKAEVEEVLHKNGVPSSFIGTFTKNKERILIGDYIDSVFPQEVNDPYAKILSSTF
jgi:hydrogenase maturation factor